MKQLSSNCLNVVVWFVSFVLLTTKNQRPAFLKTCQLFPSNPSLLTKENHTCHLFANIANEIAISGPMNVATNFTRNV